MVNQIIDTISSFTLAVIESTRYVGIFFLMALESANIPIPSEVIMPFSGFLVTKGILLFWAVVVAGALGNLVGSLFSYWLGYLVRINTISWSKTHLESELERAHRWVGRFGDDAAFISRLLPVVRTFISFPLGYIGVKSIPRFSLLTFLGSFIWCIPLTYIGVVFGKNWHNVEPFFRKFSYLILAVILAIIGYIAWEIWQRHHMKREKRKEKRGKRKEEREKRKVIP